MPHLGSFFLPQKKIWALLDPSVCERIGVTRTGCEPVIDEKFNKVLVIDMVGLFQAVMGTLHGACDVVVRRGDGWARAIRW